MMKNSKLLTLLAIAAGFCAIFRAEASDSGMITIDALKNGASDYAAAEKIFATNDPNVVFHLVPLSEKEIGRAKGLPDWNRFSFALKQQAQEEYHYTLESAAEQAEKEKQKLEQVNTKVQKKEDKPDNITGKISFYVTSSRGGITFVFRQTGGRSIGTYEIILDPLEANRFGNQGIHLTFQRNSWYGSFLGWKYQESASFRPESSLREDGSIITKVTITWDSIYRITGAMLMNVGRTAQWKVGVFRWAKDVSLTLKGIPFAANGTYLMIPPFRQNEVAETKAGMLTGAVTGFYAEDPKKGNPTKSRFGYMKGQRDSLPFWKERFHVIYRLGYPLSFSEYCLAYFPRRVAKVYVGDDEKTKENNLRSVEWQEYMAELGNYLKAHAKDYGMVDAFFLYYYEKFAFIDPNFDALQLEAIRDRTFSDKFLNEE